MAHRQDRAAESVKSVSADWKHSTAFAPQRQHRADFRSPVQKPSESCYPAADGPIRQEKLLLFLETTSSAEKWSLGWRKRPNQPWNSHWTGENDQTSLGMVVGLAKTSKPALEWSLVWQKRPNQPWNGRWAGENDQTTGGMVIRRRPSAKNPLPVQPNGLLSAHKP
jgi:hypothetical protein